MLYLLDTSVLARLANVADPFHTVAARAVFDLHRRGDILHVTPQNFVEFRNFATRPKRQNGLELTISEAEAKAAIFETTFTMLPDVAGIFSAWKALVSGLAIVGKQVHDARLVAVCHVHGVTHVLTFNVSHFTRMATFGCGINVIDPATV